MSHLKDFKIANNLSSNRTGVLWRYSDLLPLGGDLSLVLLIEIVPRNSGLNTVTVYLQMCLYGIEKIAVVGFFLLPPLPPPQNKASV